MSGDAEGTGPLRRPAPKVLRPDPRTDAPSVATARWALRLLVGLPLLANALWLTLVYMPEVCRALSGSYSAGDEVRAGLRILGALTAGLSSVSMPANGCFAPAPSVMSVAGLVTAMALWLASRARKGSISAIKPGVVGLAAAFTLQIAYWAQEGWTSNDDRVWVLVGISPAMLLIPAAVVVARSSDVREEPLAPWPLEVLVTAVVSLPLGRLIYAREFAVSPGQLLGESRELVRVMASYGSVGLIVVAVFWWAWQSFLWAWQRLTDGSSPEIIVLFLLPPALLFGLLSALDAVLAHGVAVGVTAGVATGVALRVLVRLGHFAERPRPE